jgi:dynein heavy chain
LEKVEFGGVKGKALSARVVIIYDEFKTEFEKFGNKKYDPLEPSSDEFKQDYDEFCRFTLDLDRRLSSTICQGFDDCNSLQSAFKLVTILGNLLERKTIAQDFEPKYYILGEMLEAEMDASKVIFDQQVCIFGGSNILFQLEFFFLARIFFLTHVYFNLLSLFFPGLII